MQVQPSEFAKLFIIAFLSSFLSENKNVLTLPSRGWKVLHFPPFRFLAPLLLIWSAAMLMFVSLRDLGSALLFFGIVIIMTYVATGKKIYVFLALFFFSVSSYISYLFFEHVRTRVAIWLHPWDDPMGSAYQIVQSLFAFSYGGIFGTGFSFGFPLLIPEVHTDFIFAAIGEEFGLKPGEISTKKLYTALRRLGIDYVFDTNFGADLTIMEEGYELLDRIKKGGVMPQLTSCCPGWINYIEEYYPDLLENLSSAKSPMMMQGAITKTYWAEKAGIDKKNIYSVAIMPCTAKKTEIRRDGEHAKSSGEWDVDLVLTTREIARLIASRGLDFKNLPETEADSPIGEYTGAGTIFGVTGGVMEAAIRTAYYGLTGKELADPEIKLVRGLDDIKRGEVDVDGKKVRVAVVHGMAAAKPLLDQIRKDKQEGKPSDLDFIEIMACRGGCIAGGGQPYGTDDEVREERTEGLYTDDEKSVKRCSHQNPSIQTLYKEFLGEPLSEKAHHLLHTEYQEQPLYKG